MDSVENFEGEVGCVIAEDPFMFAGMQNIIKFSFAWRMCG